MAQKILHSDLGTSLELWAQFVLFWHCLQARLLGNSYWFSLKIVPFHIIFALCCCSQAENMPTGVLITHILAVAGLASGSSFKSTRQQNIFIPCFPREIQKSSSSPVNMIIQSNVSRWMRTGGLTFPHGAVGSLEIWDKRGLQACLDYLMPLVPEVASPSLSPPSSKTSKELQ